MMSELLGHIEQVFIITCTRCKYEGIDYQDWLNEAAREFARRGWTYEPPMIFCPVCNGKPTQFG